MRLILLCSLLYCLNGCSTYTPDKGGVYTTQQNINLRPLLKQFVFFQVNHTGGEALDTCLKSFYTVTKDRLAVDILVPCALYSTFEKNLNLLNNKDIAIYKAVTVALQQLPLFYDRFNFTQGLNYQVKLLILPKNTSYHYTKTFFHFNEPKLFIGVNLDLDKPDFNDLLNQVVISSVHETLHFVALINGMLDQDRADFRYQHEYFAYLASYCANADYALSVNRPMYRFPTTFQNGIFKRISKASYSDLANKLTYTTESSKEPIFESTSGLVNLFLQRDILQVIDGTPELILNKQQTRQFSDYCHIKLNKFLEKNLKLGAS